MNKKHWKKEVTLIADASEYPVQQSYHETVIQ